MAITFKIHLVHNNIIAFSIDYDLYFLKTLPVPQLFNADLVQQIVYNFDSWFQAKTQQRYCYRGVLDMAEAFADGLKLSYGLDDLRALTAATAVAAKNYVLTDRMSDYRKHFWIEILDPAKLDTTVAVHLREKFDHLRSKLGDDAFYNNLCRLWRLASKLRPGAATVFEGLIRRLGRVPEEPVYPTTPDLDSDLVKSVLVLMLGRGVGLYKGIAPAIQDKVERLQHGDRSSHSPGHP
jgi:hypothetical protein